jgi:hypothetical protein
MQLCMQASAIVTQLDARWLHACWCAPCLLQSALFDESCADRVEALVAGRAAAGGLVVCASLLDNVPNLAGLCR